MTAALESRQRLDSLGSSPLYKCDHCPRVAPSLEEATWSEGLTTFGPAYLCPDCRAGICGSSDPWVCGPTLTGRLLGGLR